MMKSEHVNPFIKATISTFETMCDVVPERAGDLAIRSGMMSTYDLLGVIGLSGAVKGAVLLTMPIDVGLHCISSFVGEELKEVDAEFMDAYGEILNIIAGAAAANLEGYNVNLALPTVLIGQGQQVSSKEASPWVVIPMAFPQWGKFNIEVSMEES